MNLEEQLAIKLSSFIAGIAGGIISLTFEHQLSALRALLLIFAGGTTAGYAFKGIEVYYQANPNLSGVVGFALGLTSMKLISILMSVVEAARKDPSILLSYAKLIRALKDDRGTSLDAQPAISSEPSVHAAGESTPPDSAEPCDVPKGVD